jgi:hypothetical protein
MSSGFGDRPIGLQGGKIMSGLTRRSPGQDGNRWLAIYRIYLFIAAVFSLISLVRFISMGPPLLVLGAPIARLGLFVFAIYSLKSFGDVWVRNLHLAINGAASIVMLLTFMSPGLAWSLSFWSVVTFPTDFLFASRLLPLSVVSTAIPVIWLVFWIRQIPADPPKHPVRKAILSSIATIVGFVLVGLGMTLWEAGDEPGGFFVQILGLFALAPGVVLSLFGLVGLWKVIPRVSVGSPSDAGPESPNVDIDGDLVVAMANETENEQEVETGESSPYYGFLFMFLWFVIAVPMTISSCSADWSKHEDSTFVDFLPTMTVIAVAFAIFFLGMKFFGGMGRRKAAEALGGMVAFIAVLFRLGR